MVSPNESCISSSYQARNQLAIQMQAVVAEMVDEATMVNSTRPLGHHF